MALNTSFKAACKKKGFAFCCFFLFKTSNTLLLLQQIHPITNELSFMLAVDKRLPGEATSLSDPEAVASGLLSHGLCSRVLPYLERSAGARLLARQPSSVLICKIFVHLYWPLFILL